MKKIIDDINQILSEWDPLGIGEDIITDEYRGYIPVVLKHIKSKEELTSCLEDILVNSLQTGYDKKNNNHKNMLMLIVEKIMRLNVTL